MRSIIQRLFTTNNVRPKLSIVLIVYRMPEQARKTLYSLSMAYQQGVTADEYEVIVVENSSPEIMGDEYLKELDGNFRYFYREETVPTPLPAISYGADLCIGQYISIMIDGARMATPGLIKNIIAATGLCKMPVIAAPGYHLGDQLQQQASEAGYNRVQEQELLDSIAWPNDGYRLFEISCFSGSCRAGFFLPNSESNCLTVSKEVWQTLGGIEQGFTTTGGGLANLDLYKRACELPGATLITLASEGTFHQFHGGATTGGKRGKEREDLMQAQLDQYISLRGSPFKQPEVNPLLLGQFHPATYPFLEQSIETAKQTHRIRTNNGS
ncbi:MAG: glycosyltransferase [Pseudomonadota bacterium]